MTVKQVKEQIASKVLKHEGSLQYRLSEFPEEFHDSLRNFYAYSIQEERTKYSTVRVRKYRGKYWLYYEGKRSTGGFNTKGEAESWFLDGGR